LNVFVDKCSVEIFLDGGKIAMTNLVFPNAPYNRMSFYGNGGSYRVDKCAIYKLEL
ncbi:MAG: GH32 C-terminal domain-containing protein, partial [Bacteroides sp.]|nr:GH32 C-terminal domain-containing protein [Bacteroides sp.]